MIIAERLRSLREDKKLSQGDIERRTGLHRCYLSRVENGHTVPSLETLERLARGLQVPLYRIVYNGDTPPMLEKSVPRKDHEWGHSGRHAHYLSKLRKALAAMSIDDRKLLLYMLQRMAALR